MSKYNSHNYNLCIGMQNLGLSNNNGKGRFPRVFRPKHNPNYQKVDNSPMKVKRRNLHPSETKYQEILDMLDESIVVENIVEINNTVLKHEYKLKKKQKQRTYGHVSEELLFHGTDKNSAHDISIYNFDWRLYGQHVGNKFGQGVSFSNCSKYASHYSDDEDHKVMVVAKVLISNRCKGHAQMVLPPPGYDTSQNESGSVIVKYEDNEFYPAYNLYYHFDDNDDSSSDDNTDSYSDESGESYDDYSDDSYSDDYDYY